MSMRIPVQEETGQERFQKEIKNFGSIYKEFKKDIEAREKRLIEFDGEFLGAPSRWNLAFDIRLDAMRAENSDRDAGATGESEQAELAQTARSTKGKISKSGKGRTKRTALEERFPGPESATKSALASLIYEYQLFSLCPETVLVQETIGGKKQPEYWAPVESDDPIFWRTLLEIFCRLQLADRGAPAFWDKRRYFELACDALLLRSQLPNWSKKAAAEVLAKDEYLRKKYVETSRADDPKRDQKSVRGASGLERRLAELEIWIGRLDDEALGRLRQMDPALFDEVFHHRVEEFNSRPRKSF